MPTQVQIAHRSVLRRRYSGSPGALARHPTHDHPPRPPLVAVRALRLAGDVQVSAQDVDTGLPPRGGRRARLGIISGCPQIVPVGSRCPATKRPARWHPAALQMLVKQRSRNPRSRSRRGPNRWSRRQCRHRCRHQCRRRNPGHHHDHCRRRRNRSRSQCRTRSRCRRRRRQRPTRSAATSSPGGPVPAPDPRLSRRCTPAARSCHHDGALILPVGA
jgi:hypothetical protein